MTDNLKNKKMEQYDLKELPKRYYSPSDSYEYYDSLTDTFYNLSGDALRDPSDYDTDTEGYTPFGDE